MVQGRDGVLIPLCEAIAVAAVPQSDETGRVCIQTLFDIGVPEVMIALQNNGLYPTPYAQADSVCNFLPVGSWRSSFEIHLYVKVPLELEIVAQVACAAHQQIVVYGLFLEYRH